jgi:hypothetical protein
MVDLENPTIELAEANMPDGSEIYTLGEETITPDQYAYDFSFPKEDGHRIHISGPTCHSPSVMRNCQKRSCPRVMRSMRPFCRECGSLQRQIGATRSSREGNCRVDPGASRKLLTYHDSWAYFATNYGMTVIGAIQPSDFSEPSPRDVADLIDQIRDEDVKVIFGSEVFPSDVLEQIASETGAQYVDDLRDDASRQTGVARAYHIGMMKLNLEIMANALGGDSELMAGIDPADTFLP